MDAIFLPCGTGTTQAGLIYGVGAIDVDVIGITIARTKKRCEEEICATLREMHKLTGTHNAKYDVKILDPKLGKYGSENVKMRDVICSLAKSDGIYLDPIYNAKAFTGMIDYLSQNLKYKNVLYINTGGTPNIFRK